MVVIDIGFAGNCTTNTLQQLPTNHRLWVTLTNINNFLTLIVSNFSYCLLSLLKTWSILNDLVSIGTLVMVKVIFTCILFSISHAINYILQLVIRGNVWLEQQQTLGNGICWFQCLFCQRTVLDMEVHTIFMTKLIAC